MFEDSLVESAALPRTRNRWPALLSVTAQCAIAVVIVALPLLHPELLPLPRALFATLAPPRPPAPPPPIHIARPTPSASSAAQLAAPPSGATHLFRSLIDLRGPAVDAPVLPAVSISSANPSAPLGVNSAAPSTPHVTEVRASSAPTPRISNGVFAGLLLAPIRPDYPAIARITRTQGTVVIEAIISATGRIESAHAVGGPAVLQQSALDAVRRARYRPYLLNGQPTAVETTITIHFTLGG